MRHPVEPFIVSQPFGVYNEIYAPPYHNGIDLVVPNGTPVKCTNQKESLVHKTIEETVGTSGTRGKGMWCVEKEPDAEGKYLVTIYWHLQEFLKAEGDTVYPGEVIALSNNTGMSSGPHLHFGIKYYKKNQYGDFYTVDATNQYSGFVDPMPLFMTINQEELEKIYLAVFGRMPDVNALGYLNHELAWVLDRLMESPEYQADAHALQAIHAKFAVKL